MTEGFFLHPAAVFFLGAALLPWVRGRFRGVYLLLIPVVAGLALLAASPGVYGVYAFLGQELILGRVDALSRLFGVIFILMAFIGIVYGLHEKGKTEHSAAALIYVGGALGVVFAGDYISVFIFSEVMLFSSVFLIWLQRDAASLAAGFRYILMHLFGGVCLLGGVVIQLVETGSTAFEPTAVNGIGPVLILIGFLVNAAVPPLSAWLSDAYPEATVTGAVFLSAFTTKTAVYTLIRGFPGTEELVWLGAVMAIYGVVYAVLENDIRRLLAYHIISQVGFMVAAVGMGTELALNGSSAHAFAHILYKGLLFMGAGAVIHMTGKRKLTELGGLYRSMPITLTLYMIGGFSISAFPLFSGFVSKSMVLVAAQESHLTTIWLMLMLASAGTFLHTGLKLPYYVFFGKDSGIRVSEPPANMLWAMGLAALLCVGIGVAPQTLYALLPYAVDYAPYTTHKVVGTLQVLLFTALGFMLLLKQLDPEPKISLDTDWFYRKGARGLLWLAAHPIARADALLGEAYLTLILNPTERLVQWLWVFERRVIDGAVNGVASVAHACALRMRRIQSGQLQHYALAMVVGVSVFLVYLILF